SRTSQFEMDNLNTIVNALKPLILADAKHHKMTAIIEISDVPDFSLNSKEIRQIILNLCRNALEAMAPGGRLVIKTYLENDQVVLSIQDQGKGINPEILKKLGTPFLTDKENGNGLGLSICYSIAARHNAAIEVSTSSKGTMFFVKFKL
ncbi:MAG: hybrid sensor histidine kinase/response regulator, partial [Desulfosporosinus sp.]|nr:hybrid sensor histidine kinase/response regulator [Desulfosporosinus sp.]